jgi:hypothetical protein
VYAPALDPNARLCQPCALQWATQGVPGFTTETSLTLVRDNAQVAMDDVAALTRTGDQLAAGVVRLTGPGSAAVRAAAAELARTLALYVQNQRRLAAETLREDPAAGANP